MIEKISDFGAGSGNRTRTLSLEGSYDTISPYPRRVRGVCQRNFNVKSGSAEYPHFGTAKILWPGLAGFRLPTYSLAIECKSAGANNNHSPQQSQTIWPFTKKYIAQY